MVCIYLVVCSPNWGINVIEVVRQILDHAATVEEMQDEDKPIHTYQFKEHNRDLDGEKHSMTNTRSKIIHELVWDTRSEEHTSELQSRGHLVCRLLLEKKKQ